MTPFKLVRKIGKILRGGAGRKEIFLGALCGVLIGFNFVGGLSLVLLILLTLLLNANLAFVLLGAGVGRLVALLLAPVSFHTGVLLIHRIGLEGLFRKLVDMPVVTWLHPEVYAHVGGLPYALITGVLLGRLCIALVTRAREAMLRAGENPKAAKVAAFPLTRFLLWIVFGKKKVSTEDVLQKKSPWIRPAGIILFAGTATILILLQYFCFDRIARCMLVSALERANGAEVNIEKVDFSSTDGRLEIRGLQVTDPEQPELDRLRIDRLVTDVSIKELLARRFAVDEIAIDRVQLGVPRARPGKVFRRPPPPPPAPAEEAEEKGAVPLGTWIEQAKRWRKIAARAADYFRAHPPAAPQKEAKETAAAPEKPSPIDLARLEAERKGYLYAAADLARKHPTWVVYHLDIARLEIGHGVPPGKFFAINLSSHPELFGKLVILTALSPEDGAPPLLKLRLHYENPAEPHELAVHLPGIDLAALHTAESCPIELRGGRADFSLEGTFRPDRLNLPFSIELHNLQAAVRPGRSVLGMDAKTASEALKSLPKLRIEGTIVGSLAAPRVKVDFRKLAKSLREALVAAGKKELSRRAGKEIEKAAEKLREHTGDLPVDVEKTGKGLLKKLF